MFDFVMVLFLILLISTIAGLFAPSIFRLESRKSVLKYSGIAFSIWFVLLLIFAPKQEESTDSIQSQPTLEQPKQEQQQDKKDLIPPFEISVTSSIVKKVDGKHRYFFDILNNDDRVFNGNVEIKIFNDQTSAPLGGDSFSTKIPLEKGRAQYVYIDINTGPVSIHGEYGSTRFEYLIKIDDQIAGSGNGKISEKYEDADLLLNELGQ